MNGDEKDKREPQKHEISSKTLVQKMNHSHLNEVK